MPGGDKNIRPEDGKQFSKDYQPPNAGRKPRVFSQMAKEFKDRGIEKATPEAVKEAYEYLLALTLLEVIEIAGTPKDEKNDYPVIVRACAQELTGKRKRDILNDMLNRAHGSAAQNVNMNVKNVPADEGEFTDEQLAQLRQIVDGNGESDNSANSTQVSGKRRAG